MQNSLNKEGNIVEFSSTKSGNATDVIKGTGVANKEFMSQISQLKETQKPAQITPISINCVHVIKKDGTREEFDASKIVNAVKKSATRMLVNLSEEETNAIDEYVENILYVAILENISGYVNPEPFKKPLKEKSKKIFDENYKK